MNQEVKEIISNKSKEQKESVELQAMDEELFEALLDSCESLDEGNEGVVLLLDSQKVDFELTKQLKEKHVFDDNATPERAVKLLKIYRPGTAFKEAQAQEQARQIIKDNEGSGQLLARVPKVSGCFNISLSSGLLKSMLKNRHLDIDQNNKIEMLVMDLAPGIDLRSYIANRLIEANIHLKEQAQILKKNLGYGPSEMLPYRYIQNFVELHLDFMNPPRELRYPSAWDYGKNIEKMQEQMQRNNVALPKKIFDVLANTIKLWQANGFYHNDLHERNVLVDLDDAGGVRDIWVLDFGYSGELDKESKFDDTIVRRWQEFTKTETEHNEGQYRRLFQGIVNRWQSLAGKESFKDALDKIDGLVVGADIESLARHIKNQANLIEPILGNNRNLTEVVLWLYLYKKDEDLAKKTVESIIKSIPLKKKGADPFVVNYNFWQQMKKIIDSDFGERIIKARLADIDKMVKK